jgi:hypothetical protein
MPTGNGDIGLDVWVDQDGGGLGILEKTIESIAAQDIESTRTTYQRWWKLFWNRSLIKISGANGAECYL